MSVSKGCVPGWTDVGMKPESLEVADVARHPAAATAKRLAV